MATKQPTGAAAADDSTRQATQSSVKVALLGGAETEAAGRNLAVWLDRIGGLWTLGVLILLILAFGVVAPGFFSQANWVATSEYAMEYLLLALGQTFVIVTAGIDLSVGANLGFASMASAVLMADLMGNGSGSVWLVVLGAVIAVGAGTLIGLLNGLLITRLKLPPFIATLGTLGIATGATFLLHNGAEVSNLPSQVGTIGSTVIAGWFPVPVLVAAFFSAVCWLLLSKTRFGIRTYAIGSNQTAARRAGINVERHLMWVYILTGFLAGVAGFLVMSRFSVGNPLAGANDELDAIAAVVIGGASLFGGRGTIAGAIIGTFVISVLVTGLVLANVQAFWQQVAVGAVLIGAVWVDQLRNRLRER